MTRILFALAGLALVGGCMMPQQVQGVPENAKTIAVASSLSPNLLLTSDTTRQSIGWDVNGRLVREASKLLDGRYKVVPFVVDPTDDDKRKSALERVRSVIAPGVADIILLAEPPLSLVNQFETSPRLSGSSDDAAYINRFERPKPLFDPSDPEIVSAFGIAYQWTVLDGQTFKMLARSVAVIPPERIYVGEDVARQNGGFTLASSESDIGWNGQPYADVSETQRAAIDAALTTVLSDSVATTLYRLKLADRSVVKVYDTELSAGPTMATLVGSRIETPTLQRNVRTYLSAIDGRATMLTIKQLDKVVAVPAGQHTVRIFAAQGLHSDGLATVTATLQPGRDYVLRASRLNDAAPLPKLMFDCCENIPTPSAWIEDAATGDIVSDVVPMKVRNMDPGVIFIPVRGK